LNIGWAKNESLDKHSWVIILHLDHADKYKESILNEVLQNNFMENVNCGFCTHPQPCYIKDLEIFGKYGLCGQPLTWIQDPDETTVNIIKRLLEFERRAREAEINKNKA
jgi:hypothetical protein